MFAFWSGGVAWVAWTVFGSPFVAEVDSKNGLDLNQVQFDLSGPTGNFTLGIKNYGGGLSTVPTTGVYAKVEAEAVGDFPGVDMFRIDSPQVPADLPNGQYRLKITATNIAGHPNPLIARLK